jgi:PIN domain nuclease of toxin-antitoxin system
MQYLIDTQILLWTLIAPEKLSKRTLHILQNDEIFVSQISFFEIAIKQKIGKLPELAMPISDFIALIREDGFQVLPLKEAHFASYGVIPLFADHRDPFDRLILATSLCEDIPVISADEKFKLYANIVNLIEN